MSRTLALTITVIIGAWVLLPVQAAVVHKWVDADGVTHYSDEPPEIGEAPVTRIEIEAIAVESGGVESAKSDYYSISKQWERMHRERLERDKLNLERARLKAAQPAEQRVVYVDEAREKRYSIAYPGRLRHKFGHRGHHRKYKYHSGGGPRKHYRSNRTSLGGYRHIE